MGMKLKHWSLFFGPAMAFVVGGLLWWNELPEAACLTAGVTTLCAVWWVFEPIPIPATSIIPFALFPLFGVLTHKQSSEAYGDKLVLLLLGGSILSMAMESSGAHRRVALGMVRAVGGRGGRRLVLGFMLAAAALSMWISNTATTLMLLPVALAVLADTKDEELAIPLLLGLAYASSVGGIGTPLGTTPNLLFISVYRERTGVEITFFEWMKIGLPVVVVMLPIIWLWVTRRLKKAEPIDLPTLGPWRSPETRVLIVFGVTALAWMTRRDPFGGWSEWLGLPNAHDSNVALVAVVAMFLIPDGEGRRLLNWETAVKVPWGLFLLFGGGLAIAKAFTVSGLGEAIGGLLDELTTMPTLAMMLVVCLCVTFLTEVTSNTATTALLMPVLAIAGAAAGVEPKLLMLPAAISASCAFMLPVATAPNAVVFGTGRFTVADMARTGVALNLIGAGAVTTVLYLLLVGWG